MLKSSLLLKGRTIYAVSKPTTTGAKKLIKKAGKISLVFFLVIGIPYIWYVHFDYRFGVITENRVYKSGKIPPDQIADYIIKRNIKTVIDLRAPELSDPLNPGKQDGIDLERAAVEKLPGVRYVNIPSAQVPSKENLVKFFEVMDDSASYPVLIHCYHGTGRAIIYSAIYRIEYEGMESEQARQKTRLKLYGSSFDRGEPKGDFLINYKARKEGNDSTLNTM
ncbi:MAG: dual specificity protein phosphatase family protein [Gammaproteobacteria bacterium]|nr:dual specificity protein phosphatase family protein [Gammaproteobacteria bacterium]